MGANPLLLNESTSPRAAGPADAAEDLLAIRDLVDPRRRLATAKQYVARAGIDRLPDADLRAVAHRLDVPPTVVGRLNLVAAIVHQAATEPKVDTSQREATARCTTDLDDQLRTTPPARPRELADELLRVLMETPTPATNEDAEQLAEHLAAAITASGPTDTAALRNEHAAADHRGLDELDARRLLCRSIYERVADKLDDGYGSEPFPWHEADRLADELLDILGGAGFRIVRSPDPTRAVEATRERLATYTRPPSARTGVPEAVVAGNPAGRRP
jgi:hypothetical protein